MFRRDYLKSMLGFSAPRCPEGAESGQPDLVRALLEACFQRRDLEAALNLLAPNYVCRGSFGDWDRAAWREAMAALHENVDGLRIRVEDLIFSDGRVAFRWSLRGTHRASGRRFQLDGINIDRISAGRIVESRVAADLLPCLRELGMVPAGGWL